MVHRQHAHWSHPDQQIWSNTAHLASVRDRHLVLGGFDVLSGRARWSDERRRRLLSVGAKGAMRDQPKSASKIIDDVVNRLAALERDRTYRFRATRRADAERYLARSGAIVGCSDDEVSAREAVLGGRYPDVFRTYLLTLGRRSGRLFQGSDIGFDRHNELGRSAAELLAAEVAEEALPIDAEVFLVHQGYSFMYVRAVGGFDSPVYRFVEGQDTVKVESDSFAGLLETELARMEANDRASRDAGGTWIRVSPDGSITQTFPARASGERPLDHPDDYLD